MKNKNTELFFKMDSEKIPWNKTDPGYSAFWERELEKVERGLTIDGYHFSGWLYWHINHWKLMADIMTEWGEIVPKEITPILRDNEIIINEELKIAERNRAGIVIMGLRQFSKDLLNSSKLYQKDKEITIGDCKVGDQIYDDSGRLTTIIGKYPQGIRPVYELSLLDGRKIMCGQNHNWYVYDRILKKYTVKTTKELLTNYKLYRDSWKHRKNSYEFRYYIPNNQPVQYEEKSLPIDPYILGLWLGDGHSNGTNFTNTDEEIINSLYAFAKSRGLKIVNYDGISYRITTGINGGGRNAKIKNTFLEDLKSLNLINNKHIPSIYLYSSIEQRLELLRGLMDSDGTSVKSGTLGYCTTSELLANNFFSLCRSLGIILNKKKNFPSCVYKNTKVYGKPCYNFNIFTDLPIFKLKRKLANQNTTKKRYKDKIAISNIEYKFDDETTCITVDNKSHLFLTDNYTITHNTSMESSYAGRAAVIYSGSQNLLMGTSADDLNNLTQVLDYGLLNCSTYFRIPRISRDWDKERVLLGYKSKKGDNKVHSTFVIRNTAGGTKTEKGAGVSNLKSNIWDEIGKNDFLQALIGTKPAMLSQFGWRCIPICVGTGGNVEKAQDAKKLFFTPSAHNFIEHTQSDGRKTGLFLPGTLRQDCKYKTSLAKYLIDSGIKVDISDDSELWDIEILASDEELAKKKIEKELEDFKRDGDLASYNRWKAYYPLSVDDVFLSESHNNFPIEACKAQRKWLELNYTPEYIELFRNERNKVDWKYSNNKPINKYPVSAKDLLDYGDIPVVVHEHPDPDAPFATYCIGIDPYNENESSDKINSTGSIYVYKRMYKSGDQFSNRIVAHWTGRCKTVTHFHELALMITEYYNAIEGVLPENEDKTLIQYFLLKRKGLFFAKALDLSKEINANTKSNRLIGLSAATPNQRHYMNLLVEEAKDETETIDEEGNIEVYSGVSRVLDPMLLTEYIEYKGKDSSSRGVHDINCDRIVAYGHAKTLAKFYDVKYPIEVSSKPINSPPPSREFKIKTVFGEIRPKTKSPFNTNKQTNRPRGINFI